MRNSQISVKTQVFNNLPLTATNVVFAFFHTRIALVFFFLSYAKLFYC